MTDETEKPEARPYVIVYADDVEELGCDARPLKEIVAKIAEARKVAVAKENMATFTAYPILEGDEDGDGVVWVFEPLTIKRLRTPYDIEDGDGDGDDLPELNLPAGEEPTEAPVTGSLFTLTGGRADAPAS